MIHVYVPPVYTLNTTYTVIVKFDLFTKDSEFFKGSVDYEIKIPVLTVHVSIFSALNSIVPQTSFHILHAYFI